MADEPTGALDSSTGRAVLDTLKKLSADKLVIVVSHDREFAEKYADRIIELADGQVISDMEYTSETAPQETQAQPTYDGDTVRIPAGYHLTEEDRLKINEYIDRLGKDATLRAERSDGKRIARPTAPGKITAGQTGNLRKIKSRLPLRCAFRIGASGLTHKKIRLTFTILLSCVAFVLFGLADTFGAYNHVRTCARSLTDSGITYATVQKQVRVADSDEPYYTTHGARFLTEDIEKLNHETGQPVVGVWTPEGWRLDWEEQCGEFSEETEKFQAMGYYSTSATGFSEMTEQSLERAGMKLLSGRLPDGQRDEIALSSYLCETFLAAGYIPVDADGNPTGGVVSLSGTRDMIGKTLCLNGKLYTVTGIFDANVDMERYRSQWESYYGRTLSTAEDLILYAMMSEFGAAVNYSTARVILVGEGFADRLRTELPAEISLGTYGTATLSCENTQMVYSLSVADLRAVDSSLVLWAQGHVPSLGKGEIIVTMDMLLFGLLGEEADALYSAGTPEELQEALPAVLGTDGLTVKWKASWYDGTLETGEYRVVGVIDNMFFGYDRDIPEQCVIGEELYGRVAELSEEISYQMAIAPMPHSGAEIRGLVAYCYDDSAPVRFAMCNTVTFELDIVHSVLKVLAKVFLYIGIGFAVFASLMLANFIGTSIAYKKQEIGILRAIGSRGNDVFRIFFAESFIIAMINFVLSSVGVGLVTTAINRALRRSAGILITVLDFSLRQILLLFVVSVAVAALASFLPVRRIASKRPIDAIRNR